MKAKFKNYRYYMAPDNYYHLVLPDYENHRAYDFADEKFYMASREANSRRAYIAMNEKEYILEPIDELVYDMGLCRSLDSTDIKSYLLQKKIVGAIEKTIFGNEGLSIGQLERLSDNMTKFQESRFKLYNKGNEKAGKKMIARREALDDLYEEKNR